MNPFEFTPEPRRYEPTSPWSLWLPIFTSVLCALLIGSVVIGFALRGYLRWSVADSVNEIKNERTPRP